MSENSGFSQEQLVIFKLGHIESTLDSIQSHLADSAVRMTAEREHINTRLDGHDNDVKDLQKFKNYGLALMAVATLVITFGKEILFKWLNFH